MLEWRVNAHRSLLLLVVDGLLPLLLPSPLTVRRQFPVHSLLLHIPLLAPTLVLVHGLFVHILLLMQCFGACRWR